MTSKRAESRGKGRPPLSKYRNKAKAPPIEINPDLIYAEREIWSPQYSLWTRFSVRLPRLPDPEESTTRWVDSPDNSPHSFASYIGSHNQEYFNSLNNYVDLLEQAKFLPDAIVITGAPGSGKSSSVRILLSKFGDCLNLASHQFGKWCMDLDAKKYTQDFNMMWARIDRFADPPMDRVVAAKFRLVVIDNFEVIPPSAQQIFKKSVMALGPKAKYIFICNTDPKTSMIAFLLSKGTVLKTKAISERDALSVILSICHRNKIGFELEGIQALFSAHPNLSCSAIIDLAQQVFLQHHFISDANVYKVLGKVLDPPVINQMTVLEPLERCSICTLKPPCQHYTEEFLQQLGVQRRKELPRYRDGSMICPEFARYGHCTMFNRYGLCSLDHPKNIHRVSKPIRRCEQCTIPWPCNHCAYSSYRANLKTIMEELQHRIGRLRQINVPEPPLTFMKYLVSVFEAIEGFAVRFDSLRFCLCLCISP